MDISEKDSTISYLNKIYIMHIILIAIPLIIIGVRGQLGYEVSSFEFAYIFLLGGMALVYHSFWFIKSFWGDDYTGPQTNYLRGIYLLHVFVFALPLLYYGVIGQRSEHLEQFAYTYFILIGGMALIYHGYWLGNSLYKNDII